MIPSPALFLGLATFLPLAGALLVLLIGRRLGALLTGWAASAFVIGSFACTLIAMVKWYEEKHGLMTWGMGVRPIVRALPWIPFGHGVGQYHPGFLDAGLYVDSLTIAMFAMITLVAAVIHVYSISFMRHDAHQARFFCYLGVSCFAVLGFIIAGTLIQMLIFWELIGLCTYALMGFWFESKPAAAASAYRAFVIDRIGDGALLCGFAILLMKAGNASLPILWTFLGDAAGGSAAGLPGGEIVSAKLLTAAGLFIALGAMSKCAQFPLQTWSAGAADAPSPAVALVCTAVTTAAGVYLLARCYPFLTPSARLLIAIVGVTTLTMAAAVALVQGDLHRVLAWAVASQVGYMMLAVGVGSWVGALFHLITAGFCMALLILAAGSVIDAARGEQQLTQYGGLWKKMPVTCAAFAVGVLALAGAPFLSAHFSMRIINADAAAFSSLAVSFAGRRSAYWLFFFLPTAVAYVSPIYLARCWMLIFAGKPRNEPLHAQAREHPALWAPLLALAIPAAVAGYAMAVPELVKASTTETVALCNELLAKNGIGRTTGFTAFDQTWPTEHFAAPESALVEAADLPAPAVSPASLAHEHGQSLAQRWTRWAWLAGIAFAVALYWNGYAVARRLMRFAPLRWIHTWLYSGMYFDDLYEWTIVKLVQAAAFVCASLDRLIIRTAPDGIVRLTRRARVRLRFQR